MMCSLKDWLCRAGEAKRIALIAHMSPDGDTVGATLALRLAFLRLGKAVDVICDGEVSASLDYLEGFGAYITPDQAADDYDAAIAVDVPSHNLLGSADKVFDASPVTLVIDHHATNPEYGMHNLIRRDECATCVVAYDVIQAMGIEMTADIGACLLTGMSTDTGHFQYPYTTAAAFSAAAHLREVGVDVSYITRRLYRTQPMAKVNLTRIAYQKLRFEFDGQVGVIELTKEDYESTGCTTAQGDGLVNKALEVEGVRMAVLASERENGIKMSLRAVEPDTVNDVAFAFGGGGHAQAAGCTIQAPLHTATQMILDAMKAKLG